jgi:hypothetical protein
MEKKKEIEIYFDFTYQGLEFKKGQKYIVSVLKIDVTGVINRYPEDATMDAYFGYCVLCEFENGKIIPFDINQIKIVGNAN